MNAKRISAQSWLMLAVAVLLLPAARAHAQQDSTDDEDESSWTASAHTLYQNKDNSRGVDLSNELAILGYGVRIEHLSGISLDVGGASLLGAGGGFDRWNVTLGYTYTASDWLILSGELSQFKYADDSLNAIANLTNSFTLGMTFPTKLVNVGISYNSYFGGGSASYYGLNFDRSFQKDKFSANPSLNFSFISQTIDQKRLISFKRNPNAAGKGQGKGLGQGGTGLSTSVTVTGMSGITLAVPLGYDLGRGFTLNAQPTYVYSPKAELAASTSEFLWSLGLTYSLGL
ncbi:MAG TPA: hypothetical protein VI758_09065 [Bacteroidota bacterium]